MNREEMTNEEAAALLDSLLAELCPSCYTVWNYLMTGEEEDEEEDEC